MVKALFVISTPFQAISAVEAVSFFGVTSPKFVILQGQRHSVNANAKEILEMHGFEHSDLVYLSFGSFIMKSFNDISLQKLDKKSFDIVFIGDYFNSMQRVFSSYFLTRSNRLIFLDDGGSSIEAFHNAYALRGGAPINDFVKFIIARLIFLIKPSKVREFFSIFPNHSSNSNFNIIKNDFRFLKTTVDSRAETGVFILGTNLLTMGLISENDYLEGVDNVIVHALKHFPNSTIYYCPHRGEESDFINFLCAKFGIVRYYTKFSIEVDFLINKINPVSIYSFGSTASFSLNVLYPNSLGYCFYLKTSNRKLNETYSNIRTVYTNAGIIPLDY